MTLMLRSLGVPARVAVGFTSGTYDDAKRRWTVTDHDAHAWVEVWFPHWGWLPFDPTPGRGRLEAAYSSASDSFDARGAVSAVGRFALGTSLAAKARANPTIIGERPVSQGGGGLAPVARGQGGRVLAVLALLVLAAAATVVLLKRVRRRAAYRGADARGVARACRSELVAWVADQRVVLPAAATLAELVPVVEERFGVDARPFAAAASAAAYARDGDAERARRELRTLLRALRRTLSPTSRLRGALSLRSL
jgi:transglutaminase-like putative cysteine protease